jgi:hypothetical protein
VLPAWRLLVRPLDPELADLPVRVAASRYRIGVALAVCSIDGLTSSGGFAVTGYRPMTLADLAGHLARTADGKMQWKLV